LVGPLGPDDVELLVEERLGEPLPRALHREVAAVAGGNPLYALELAAAQRRAGRLRDGLPALPARLEVLLDDRLGQLPPQAAEPLAAVAGLAAPTVALIAAVLGEPAKAGLDAAVDAGVLLVEGGGSGSPIRCWAWPRRPVWRRRLGARCTPAWPPH
jgi:hypothetical protein